MIKWVQSKGVLLLLSIITLVSNAALSQSASSLAIGEKIIHQGLLLLGKEYAGGTLDTGNQENMTYSASMFDCVTYVEYVLAKTYEVSHTSMQPVMTFEDYLKQFRYHQGIINGYGSRIHYFSQWIGQFEKNDFGKNITRELGGIKYNKKINYMSANRSKYPKLRDTSIFNQILQAEKSMNVTQLYYIPQQNIIKILPKIHTGDIIAITTDIKGLDIVHTGFAFWKNKKLYLLHASSDFKKVMISHEPLSLYIIKNRHQNGIMVIRPEIP